MTISISTGDEISEAEAPLLNDAVPGCVDFKGRPSVRSKSGCWKSSAFIIAAGVMEKFAYYGISSNMVSYLTGKLGQPTASAAAILNAWYGMTALLPILGAFVADSFTGRFPMIIIACFIYLTGLSSLTLSASITSQDPRHCKPIANTAACSPNHLHIIFFLFSFYLVGLAQGGYAPCVQAFGADQFDEDDENERRSKSAFFNWWNCINCVTNLVPILALTYIQENVSWELGFAIPAVVMCFALVLLLLGSKTYRFRMCSGKSNPIVRILVKAVRNWQAPPVAVSVEEEAQQRKSKRCASFKFLEKALVAPDGTLTEDNKTHTIADVEGAKSILRLAPLWFSCLGYSIIYSVPSTLFTKQATTLSRQITPTFELPAASLQQCFIAVSIMVFLMIYDRILVPVARNITKKPSGISMLQRIGTGLVLSLTSIVFAALVERRRLATAREYGLVDDPTSVVPMSVWWLAPQYVLSGAADVFAMVGLQEMFYDQVPGELKSIGLALYASVLGVGNILSSLLVSSIQNITKDNGQGGWFSDNMNRAHFDYFYWLLAGFSVAGLYSFIYFSKTYVYRRETVLS